eukprot:gene24050-32464_t
MVPADDDAAEASDVSAAEATTTPSVKVNDLLMQKEVDFIVPDNNNAESDNKYAEVLSTKELFAENVSKKSFKYRKIYYCFGVVVFFCITVFLALVFLFRTIDPCKLSLEKCGIFTDVEYLYSTKLEYNSTLRLCSVIHPKAGTMCQDTAYATEVYFKPRTEAGQSSNGKYADEAICKVVASNESDRNSTRTPVNGTSIKNFNKILFYRVQFKPDTKTVIAIEGSSEDKSGLTILRSIFDVPLDVEVTSARTPKSIISPLSFSKPDDIYTESYSQEIIVQYNTSLPANDTSAPQLSKNATTTYENNLLYNKTSKKIVSAKGSFFYTLVPSNSSANSANTAPSSTNNKSSESTRSAALPTTITVNSTLTKQEDDYDPATYQNLSSHDSWVDLFYAFTHITPTGTSSSNQNSTAVFDVSVSNPSPVVTDHRNLFTIEGPGLGSATTLNKDFKLASTEIFGHEIGAKATVDATICIGSLSTCSITETPQKVSVVALVLHPRDRIASRRSALSPQCNQNCNCYPDMVFNGGDADADGPNAATYRSKLTFDVDLATQSVSGVESVSQDITVYERMDSAQPFCRISTCPAGGCNTVRVVDTISGPTANTYGLVVEAYLNPVVQGRDAVCSMGFTFRLMLMFEKGKGRTMQMVSATHYDGLNYAVFVGGVTVYRFKTAVSMGIYFNCPQPGGLLISNSNFQYYDLDCQCKNPNNQINAVIYFDLYIDSSRINVCQWNMNKGIIDGWSSNPGIRSEEMQLQEQLFPPASVNPNYGVCIPTPWGFCVNFVIGFHAEASGSYNYKFITAQLQYGLNSGVYGKVGIDIWIFSIYVVAEGQLMNAVQEYAIAVKGWDNFQLPASSYLNSIKLCTYSYVHMKPITAVAYLQACWESICCCRQTCAWFVCFPFLYFCRECSQIGGTLQLMAPIGTTTKEKIWDTCMIDPPVIQPPLSKLLAPTFPPTPAPVADSTDNNDYCFPSNAMVKEMTRGFIKVQDLDYGDWVEAVDFSGNIVFKEVFLFGHKDSSPRLLLDYLNFAVGSKTLTMSSTHYARLCVADCNDQGIRDKSYKLINVYARDVKVGDIMLSIQRGDLVSGSTIAFERVDMIWVATDNGIHNPYILGADIVVNGVVASVHAVHYISNYYSPVLCTIYPIYKIIGPKYMQILAEGLHVHKYTGSMRYHYFAVILFQLVLLLLPLLYLLIARKLVAKKGLVKK